MADNYLKEALQALSAMLDDVIAEAVREDLPRQGRDRDPRALALEDVPEVLKVRVAPPYGAVLELEGRDIRPTDDLVVCVHLAADAVRLWISDLGTSLEVEMVRTTGDVESGCWWTGE